MKLNYLETSEPGILVDFFRLSDAGRVLPPIQQAEGDRVLQAMQDLEAGGIANPAEGRQVGHYWLRAPDLAPDAETTDAIRRAVRDVAQFVSESEGRFKHVLHLGVGGSALGPQLLVDALAPRDAARQMHFVDNADAETIARLLAALDLADTLVVVVSKSGGTQEVMASLACVHKAYAQADVPFAHHAVALTTPGSKLDGRAKEEGWLARFPIWTWVGGRTSIFASPGLLTLGLLGADVSEFLEGARLMDALTRKPDMEANPSLALAHCWHVAAMDWGLRNLVFLPYCDRLERLGRYLQQLIMESLSKDSGHCWTVYGTKGTTDQHAIIQHLRDGANDVLVTFVEVLEDAPEDSAIDDDVWVGDVASAFLAGTREALTEAGRACLTLTLPRLDARRVGALIALLERCVGHYATLRGINAYDQPGVEGGKRSATRFLKLQRDLLAAVASGVNPDEQVLAEHLDEKPQDVRHVLRHLRANGRI